MWSDTNRAAQAQKNARCLKFWISVEEGLYYLFSENKGADHLRSYHEADLCHFFHICKGPLTIWPVYAYTLASQKTVIKLPMLILYTEDSSSMILEEIHVQLFTYSVISW